MTPTDLQVVPKEEQISAMSLLRSAVDKGASIDTIERLAKLQREMQEFEASQQPWLANMAYGAAMTRAQEMIPRIAPDLTNPQTRSKYASYAALDRVLRPIYAKQGFSLSFNTGDSPKEEHIRVLCTVRHIAGHSEHFQIDMPNDGKGAKGGDVMTKTHATAAGASYGMRYLLKMIFNVAIGEEDKDGNAASMEEPEIVRWIDGIENCANLVELQKVFAEAYRLADQMKDKNTTGLFIRAKDKRKKELKEEGGAF